MEDWEWMSWDAISFRNNCDVLLLHFCFHSLDNNDQKLVRMRSKLFATFVETKPALASLPLKGRTISRQL